MSLAPAYPLIVILIHSDEMLKVFYTNRAYFFVCNYPGIVSIESAENYLLVCKLPITGFEIHDAIS